MMSKLDMPEQFIFVCDGSKCGKYSKDIRKIFKERIKDNDLKGEVLLVKMDCTDNCKHAPVISFQPQNVWLSEVSERKAERYFDEYILGEQ